MGTDKRERQKAGRQIRLDQARAAQARRKRTRRGVYAALLVVAVIAALFVFAPDDDDDGEVSTGGASTSSSLDGSTTAPPTTPEVTIPPAGASIEGETPCPPADGSAERTTSFSAPPPMCIDPARTYTATFTTSEGVFVAELDDETAPQTVNNFVVLARYRFYDGVAFHRIIPGFMIQGGDAVGPVPGQGDPGYAIPDELPSDASAYTTGSLAMANSGPDSGGSQFFVTVEGGGDQLSPDYTRFGQIVSGQDVVDTINQFGDAATNGTPTRVITLESVTIEEA